MTSLNSRITRRVFPFAPGLSWNLKNGNYILPYIEKDIINSYIGDKPIKIICYGGLIESFFSLSILEAYNANRNNKLFWIGNKKFKDLVKWQGLASFDDCFLEKDLFKYPTPLFNDLSGNIYCNSLLNYRELKTYYNFPIGHRKQACFNQIFDNSLMSWNNNYIPKLRSKNFPEKRKKLIAIFPDNNIDYCFNKNDCCPLEGQQWKSLYSLLCKEGFECIFVTNNSLKYYPMPTINFDLNNIFIFLNKASFVLSKQIDLLLLSLLVSNAKLIYNFPLKKISIREFILDKNFFFINGFYSSNDNIVCIKDFSVMNVVSNIIN